MKIPRSVEALKESFCIWLAWILPKRLVKWCYVRVVAHGSYIFFKKELSLLTPIDALSAWDSINKFNPDHFGFGKINPNFKNKESM